MKKRIFFIFIISVFLVLLVWRLYTLEFSDIVPSKVETFDSLHISTSNIMDGYEEYKIDNMTSDILNDITAILNTSSYRRSFRNLWPWGMNSVSSVKYYDGNVKQNGVIQR